MATDRYRYRFHLTERTLEKLRLLDEEGWQDLFGVITRGKPVPYNIDFSELDPVTRLCELYSIVVTQRMETKPYQAALTRLLTEYYGKTQQAGVVYTLIRVADYVKPSLYFNRLLLLVIKPEFAAMIDAKAPDGFSIHFHLVNMLMSLDTDRKLLDFLFSLRKESQHPEYYQVTIRYLYSYCGQPQFDAFMNAVFARLEDTKVRSFVLSAFREYVYYKRELVLFYNWLFKERKRLAGGKLQPVLQAFTEDIIDWLKKYRKEYVWLKGYNECLAFLTTFFKDRFSMTEAEIKALMELDEMELYNKEELFGVLGERYWRMGELWASPEDEVTVAEPAQGNLAKVISLFEDGQRRGQQTYYRQAEKSAWAVPDNAVRQSEIDDARRTVNFGV